MSKLSRVRRAALAAVVALPLWAALPASGSVAPAPTDAGSSRAERPTAYGLGAGATAPADPVTGDRRRVRLGVEFSSKRAGRINAVRFYRGTADRRTYGVQLATASGTLLARGRTRPSTAAGWRSAKLTQPVRIVPGRHYVASYVAPRGGYATTPNALTSSPPVRHKALTTWRGVFEGPPGSRVRPGRSHYSVDVRFVPRPHRDHGSSKPATVPTPPTTPTTPTTPTVPGDPGTSNDPGNAGVPDGVVLKPSGSVTVNTDGAVIDGLDISGTLTVNASNVTVRNTRVQSGAFWTVTVANRASNVRFEHVTVDGKGVAGAEGSSGIVGPGTFVAVEVTGAENGFVPGSGSLISGSYVHDLDAPGAPHYDGIQIDGGVSNTRIEKSTVDLSNHTQTSAVMIDNDFGPISNLVVDGNYLLGGGYTVYADGKFSTTDKITGVQYVNNRLGKGYYGYGLIRQASVVWSNNVDDKTGRTVSSGD